MIKCQKVITYGGLDVKSQPKWLKIDFTFLQHQTVHLYYENIESHFK